jgi:hypothetical protein
MDSSDIVRIDVNRIHPGCPPEHLRQWLRTATSPTEIAAVLSDLAEGESSRPLRMPEGGVRHEYVITHTDGKVDSIIV